MEAEGCRTAKRDCTMMPEYFLIAGAPYSYASAKNQIGLVPESGIGYIRDAVRLQKIVAT